jgi:GNAT superfamily N-acetyltransferase
MALTFRSARRDDLEAIVDMLADDGLGRGREDASRPLPAVYVEAFAAIDADPSQLQLVAEEDGAIVGTLQMTFIRGLSRRGATRGLIEGVRVAGARRGSGTGAAMMREAIAICRARGCALVQLTTDKSRKDAHRFYARLGFEASHEGFKMTL